MQKILVTIGTILCITCLSCEKNTVTPTKVSEIVDNVVEPYIALGANVGLIVGVIRKGEKTFYAYGEKELGKKEKITAQSILEIASLTKTCTAIALADMHLKNQINLDDPIEQYLPNSLKIPAFNGKKITLRHLANHTSGFPRDPENIDKDAYNKYVNYTEQKMYDFINGYTLTRAPGTKQEYSNVGYGLLGQILSLKNNSNYETMIIQRVLQPLGMKNTGITFTPNQAKNIVQGYNGKKRVESWAKYMQNIVQGGGALSSTMDDQLIYLNANLGNVSSPLTEAINLTHQLSFEYSGVGCDPIMMY